MMDGGYAGGSGPGGDAEVLGENSRALSQERFSKYAEGYVTSKTHALGHELERFIEIAQPESHWRMLDVATGGGHTALKFAPYVAQVLATDITPNMLKTAEAFIVGKGVENVTFEPADAEALPFEDDRFDLVTCRIAPHHFPNAARFVREGARVLKPGGLLLVQDQVMPEDREAAAEVNAFERLRDPSHNWAYAESDWLQMFQDAVLHIEHTEQIIKRHVFANWVEIQECAPDVVKDLVEMVRRMGEVVTDWMEPRDWGTPQASFVGHHIIIAGRKV